MRANKPLCVIPEIPDSEIDALRLPEMILEDRVDDLQDLMRVKVRTLSTDDDEIRAWERIWQNTFFSRVRPEDSIDIRSVWEPARMQHISTMLACIRFSGDPSVKVAAKRMAGDEVLGWLERNPFLYGPHYMSVMECGLRIPVFCYCLKALDHLSESARARLVGAIYEHSWLIFERLSLHSSLGNHTIAECIGLVFGGAFFRGAKDGRKWLRKGQELLKQELYHQILADGGPSEQSLGYHRFVLDLYWLVVDFLEANGLADCGSWKPKLVEGERFLKAFEDQLGRFPSIGDSDDGYAIALGIHPRRGHKDNDENMASISTFPESGYTIIRRDEDGMVLTFDHGPLGMSPLYNHGHADALSVTLSVAGEQIIVDSGTFRYNGVPEWRSYFKGTRAHSTVMIDGADQAIQETGFIWNHPYRVKLFRASMDGGRPYVAAAHDGYSRLLKSVAHKRTISFCTDSLFLIKDSFSGRGHHDCELNYHIHPGCILERNGRSVLVKKGAVEICIMLLDGKEFRIVCGEMAPPFGWYSPAYGMKVESPVLSCRISGKPDQISFITAVNLGHTMPDTTRLEEIACRL